MRSEQHRNEAFASIVNELPEKRQYIFNIIARNVDITIQISNINGFGLIQEQESE
ncbi:hypothetical protein [Algoriella sp.]|uniref:hypothetical protein n=1 Tax=Algoriella sp. TaxID=1872434 RepID=UPI002FCA3170